MPASSPSAALAALTLDQAAQISSAPDVFVSAAAAQAANAAQLRACASEEEARVYEQYCEDARSDALGTPRRVLWPEFEAAASMPQRHPSFAMTSRGTSAATLAQGTIAARASRAPKALASESAPGVRRASSPPSEN